ncbi:MAG TPA: hypothetical protein VN178_00365 [Rubrobacter sp.]|jgi:hypothetical protein|nr:hypothetical protein [Rubrobacter sp.]
MDRQEMDRAIKRACRNTIGDAIRRSTKHPEDGDSGDENRGAER